MFVFINSINKHQLLIISLGNGEEFKGIERKSRISLMYQMIQSTIQLDQVDEPTRRKFEELVEQISGMITLR